MPAALGSGIPALPPQPPALAARARVHRLRDARVRTGVTRHEPTGPGTISRPSPLSAVTGGIVMRTFLGMILGALLLIVGVYLYDSMQTSSVANGQVAQNGRTIVN